MKISILKCTKGRSEVTVIPISDVQKEETGGNVSGQNDNSNDGIEGEAMLDDLNLIQAEEVVETVDACVLSFQVDEEVESDDQQRVGEKPKHLKNSFLPCVACKRQKRSGILFEKGPVLRMVRIGSMMK